MTLRDILNVKGSAVHTLDESASMDDVVQKLVKCNCGSLVITDAPADGRAGRMVGIISERDILRICAARRGPLDRQTVSEAMSRDVITALPGDSIEDTMHLMTERRVRHLPIMENGNLVGLVSIGDLVKAHHEQCVLENHYLKTYIQS